MRLSPVPILACLVLPMLAACDASSAIGPPDEQTDTAQPMLASRVEAAFAREVGDTRALVVMHDGEIVAERYGRGYGPHTRFLSWSMTKTLTGLLIGILVSDGKLALDQPAPIPAWRRSGDPRGAITVRHLMHMASGLRHNETAPRTEDGDTVRMMFLDGRDDAAAYAATQPLDHAPGSTYNYSTADSVILADIAARTLTSATEPRQRQTAVRTYLQERLFDPAGIETMFTEFDRAGTFMGGSTVQATARDWARVGELLRNDGNVGGVQIVPRAWVRFMRTPSPADPAYGGHLWLNRERPAEREQGLFPDRAGPDVIAALGYRGQFTIVDKARGVTVVRMGYSQPDEMPALRSALAQIVTFFPNQ